MSVATAATSHVAAGGATPGSLAVVLALAAATLTSVALAGRPLNLLRLTLSVVLSQVVFHLLVRFGADLPSVSDGSMWLAHSIAALATVIVLCFGERAFWRLAEIAGARLARLVVVVNALPPALGVPRHRIRGAIADRSGFRPLDVLRSPRSHRGPPLVA